MYFGARNRSNSTPSRCRTIRKGVESLVTSHETFAADWTPGREQFWPAWEAGRTAHISSFAYIFRERLRAPATGSQSLASRQVQDCRKRFMEVCSGPDRLEWPPALQRFSGSIRSGALPSLRCAASPGCLPSGLRFPEEAAPAAYSRCPHAPFRCSWPSVNALSIWARYHHESTCVGDRTSVRNRTMSGALWASTRHMIDTCGSEIAGWPGGKRWHRTQGFCSISNGTNRQASLSITISAANMNVNEELS
jgi:hypothetical protein